MRLPSVKVWESDAPTLRLLDGCARQTRREAVGITCGTFLRSVELQLDGDVVERRLHNRCLVNKDAVLRGKCTHELCLVIKATLTDLLPQPREVVDYFALLRAREQPPGRKIVEASGVVGKGWFIPLDAQLDAEEVVIPP